MQKQKNNQTQTQTQTNCFYYGKKNLYLNGNTFTMYKLTPITKPKSISQICGGERHVFILNQERQLFRIRHTDLAKNHNNYKIEFEQENTDDQIVDIDHNYFNGLFLMKSGLVYSVGTDNRFGILPLENRSEIEEKKAFLCDWFVKKQIKIKKICCTAVNNYFLSYKNTLYGNGHNTGQLGIQNQDVTVQQLPILISENVSDVYGSTRANHVFYTTFDNQLIGLGYNDLGQLGTGNYESLYTKQVVPNIDVLEIKKIALPWEASIILFKNGSILTSGLKKANGRKAGSAEFLPIRGLKNVTCINIESSKDFTIILAEGNEIYALNANFIAFQKIQSQGVPKNMNFELKSSVSNVFLYPETNRNSHEQEFLILLQTGKFSDYTFKNFDIKIHKSFVECRLNKIPIEEIEQVLNQYKNDRQLEILNFLKWVYSGVITNYSFIKEVCEKLQINNFAQKSMSDDLLLLYKDEDSKNFNLLVKLDENENEDEDVKLEEIPVHKYILYARSGLFREMFTQIDENANSVTDYSVKTIESVEILIKFFYTNKIELTADHDPQLVVEELEDAQEYYQLNKNCDLSLLLSQICKK
ncbi:btk-binding protein-related [Anaeramoeba flamelloides]|uniref:Btk-binding protein-related n=1 Tax=Anaeramoeba flamelloides TaxID=1746091 RepID=A0ABQ8Z408_9EUKA|nr:btk-binding protein-related [Anaeramoeba flamelloides]